MNKIPISFDYKGQHYEGHFNEMLGKTHWHLMINNFYCGALLFTQRGFAFHSNSGQFEDMVDEFADLIMLWYE